MQAILNVKLHEIDQNLLKIIEELVSKDVEVVIKKDVIQLEEYDKSIPLTNVMQDFAKVGYSDVFLQDLENGLKTSSVYIKTDEN